MTHDARLACLRQQFPPRQAEFLALVTAHGGYFLRRQVTRFLGRRDGGVTTAFLHYLVRRHVVRLIVGRRGTFLYHVYPKRLYALMDETDNRNRRLVMPDRIVRKLMALDLVLSQPAVTWLATEEDKVTYLTTTGGLSRTALPGTWHRHGPDPFTGTVRHFIDKAPISLAPDGTVTIAHIQGVEYSLSGFRAFLDRYARVCAGLPRVQIAWVAPRLSRLRGARSVMKAWARRTHVRSTIAGPVLRRALTAYCDTRQQIEDHRPEFSAKERRLVRDLHLRVVGPRFPDVYVDWRRRGAAAIDARVAQEKPLDLSLVGFRAVCLPGRYDLFGTAFGVASPARHKRNSARQIAADLAA
jgi:hypothetical protein